MEKLFEKQLIAY